MTRGMKSMLAGLLCLACLPAPLSASAQITKREFTYVQNDAERTEYTVKLEADSFRFTGHGRHNKTYDGLNQSCGGELKTDVTDANCVVVCVGYGFDSDEPVDYIINGIAPECGEFNARVSAKAIRERFDGKNLQVGDLLRIENYSIQDSYPAHIMIQSDTIVNYSGYGFDLFGEDFHKILRYELYYTTWTGGHVLYRDVPIEKGFVNNDDEINLLDVVAVNKHLMSGEAISYYGQLAADVDNNGVVDAVDSLQILKYCIGLLDSFEKVQN